MDQVNFELRPVPPFRLDLTVWALRRRSDNIVDRWDGKTYRRVFVLEDKPVGVATTQTGRPDEPRLLVTATGTRLPPGSIESLTVSLERMLGTREDLTGFYRSAMRDTHLRPLSLEFRGLKPPRFPTVFEALVNGIACQQFTLTSGIRILNRLTTTCGLPFQQNHTRSYAFPRPEDLLGAEPEVLRGLGFSRQKISAMTELARMATDGRIHLEGLSAVDDEAALRALCQLRGVGRWTAEYVLLRGLGRYHILPGDDIGARNKLRSWLNLEEPLDYEGVKRLLDRWKPYGGFVYFFLLLKGLAEEGSLA